MKSAVCIIPASSAASKDAKYFETYLDVFKDYNVLRLIIVFPATMGGLFVNASVTYSDEATKVTPITIKQPYSGLSGFADSLQRAVPLIVRDNPDEVLVVTSGGTTKLGHIVKLIGDVASRFGWEASFLWVAKPPNQTKYIATRVPDVCVKYTNKFSVELEDGPNGKLIVTEEKLHEY